MLLIMDLGKEAITLLLELFRSGLQGLDLIHSFGLFVEMGF